jgi:hypothetical protein
METRKRQAGATMIAALLVSLAWQAGATEFSSVYTDLQKDCRPAFDPKDDDPGDVPQNCKGPGGYAVSVGYSACTTVVSIRREKFDLVFPAQSRGVETRKLEWRLADGKPFAVILRLDEFDPAQDVCDPKKTGEVFMIKGLQGFTRINQKLRVGKTPNINVEARQLTDQGFTSGSAH